MHCHHCDRTVSPAERDDAADAGARVPLCAECVDMMVWGAYCGDCDGPIYASGDAAPRCSAVTA